jgi:glycosyltransferase involved in cell wall biosynthesis
MRIVFICPFLFRHLRGIERFTLDLAAGLVKLGAEIHLITWKESEIWPWEVLPPQIRLHALNLPRYATPWFASRSYAPLLKKINADITNVFFVWHGEEGVFQGPAKMQINLNLHFPADEVPSRYEQFRKSRLLKRVNQTIAVSHYVAEQAEPWLQVKPKVIYNGINLARFGVPSAQEKKAARKKLGIADNVPVFSTVAALEPRKGISRVLQALPKVFLGHPDSQYLIAGEGPQKEEISTEIKKMGEEKRIRLLGRVGDARLIYHASDFFVLLSSGEACGLVVLEAMACGLPVVLSQRKPFDEITDKKGAFFVNDADPAEIADNLTKLIESKEQRAGMSEINLEWVKRFDHSFMSGQYYELFEKQLKGLS